MVDAFVEDISPHYSGWTSIKHLHQSVNRNKQITPKPSLEQTHSCSIMIDVKESSCSLKYFIYTNLAINGKCNDFIYIMNIFKSIVTHLSIVILQCFMGLKFFPSLKSRLSFCQIFKNFNPHVVVPGWIGLWLIFMQTR